MILAGDIGGTKTALGLFEVAGTRLRRVRDQTYRSTDRDSFDSIVAEFCAEAGTPQLRAACFGVAGVVVEGTAVATNLPWQVSERSLARICGAPKVALLNDLEAAATGMLFLAPEDLVVLQEGGPVDPQGNVAVIAAGTGLGEAMMIWDGNRHRAIASEGGHADFAARSDLEVALYQHLRKRHGRASYEHVLSGPGFLELYRFLRAQSGTPEPETLSQQMQDGDAAAVIANQALEGHDEVCASALELFVSIYGAEAGNLALRCLPRAGVFVGGGIAPKILPALQTGNFVRAFADKGFFSAMLASVRISVALDETAALIGAAQHALRL